MAAFRTGDTRLASGFMRDREAVVIDADKPALAGLHNDGLAEPVFVHARAFIESESEKHYAELVVNLRHLNKAINGFRSLSLKVLSHAVRSLARLTDEVYRRDRAVLHGCI